MSCSPVFFVGTNQLKVSENSGASVIQCVPALRMPSWNVRYVRFGPCVLMLVWLRDTQSPKLASHIGKNPVRFCLQPGNPFGAKRSSSRVNDRRMVFTRFVARTEFREINPVSSLSH